MMNTSAPYERINTARIPCTTLLIATLSMVFPAGCGGGGHGGSSGSSGSSGGSSSAYSDRAYAAPSVPLGSNQTGTLTVAVGADAATVAGTLNLLLTSVSGESRAAVTAGVAVPLTGTLNSATGAFTLSSTVTESGTTYAVTTTGTLNASGTSNVAITLNGTSGAATLGSGTTLSGQLSAAYFPLTSNNLPYTETDNDGTDTPTTSIGSGYSFVGGYNSTTGATTQTTLNGTTVNKTAILDSTGVLYQYEYSTASTTAFTQYGYDDIDSTNGTLEDMMRFSPPYVIPLTLSAGQTYIQTGSAAHTDPTSYTSSYTEAITFNDFETITVPAGTFPAAKFTTVNTTVYPAAGPLGAYTTIDTAILYLVQNIGAVQEHDVDVVIIPASGTTAASTSTNTYDYVLNSTTSFDTSSETKSAAKSAHDSRAASPGIFGQLRGMRR